MAKRSKPTTDQIETARTRLNEIVNIDNNTVYTLYGKLLGQGRWLRCFVVEHEGEIVDITGYIADACGLRCKETPNELWIWIGGKGHSHAQAVCECLQAVLGYQPKYKTL